MRPAGLLVVFLITVTALPAVQPLSAQPTEEGVRSAIGALFEGMRFGDSTMVRATIHPEARFQTTLVRDGNPILLTGNVDEFVAAVGTPHEEIWDEKIWNLEVRVDDHLAQAWMNYAFFLGDTFSHCGVNAIQFFHDGSSWRIIQIIDTRRTGECDLPVEFETGPAGSGRGN